DPSVQRPHLEANVRAGLHLLRPDHSRNQGDLGPGRRPPRPAAQLPQGHREPPRPAGQLRPSSEARIRTNHPLIVSLLFFFTVSFFCLFSVYSVVSFFRQFGGLPPPPRRGPHPTPVPRARRFPRGERGSVAS